MSIRVGRELVPLACALLTFSCHNHSMDSDGASQPNASSGSLDKCPEHQSVDDCCCFGKPDSGYGLDTFCQAEKICPRIGIQCATGLNECSVFSLPEEVSCLLEAMAMRRVGVLTWEKTSLTAPWGVDKPSESSLLYISDDNVFLVQYRFDADRTSIAEIGRHSLKPAEYFHTCLNNPSLEAQMQCVEEGFGGLAEEVCLAGYDYPRL